MAAALRVLVLESERGPADVAIDHLRAAGHEVLRCHEPGATAFPCNGLVDHEHCPVRASAVDVALTVRPQPRSQPAPHEDGVSCALERHIPVVVAGSTARNPFADYATAFVDGTDRDLVAAVENAAAAPLPRHGAVAADALHETAVARGVDLVGAAVSVRRARGGLVVTVRGANGL